MTTRIPAHLEVSGLIRSVEAAGGFATVLYRGERESGTILIGMPPWSRPALR
ncbi:MAG: DUF1491 family protein [Sphingomonadales bacterium]|nr:DUF1491 family protein [Sphingomonadales bacterium]